MTEFDQPRDPEPRDDEHAPKRDDQAHELEQLRAELDREREQLAADRARLASQHPAAEPVPDRGSVDLSDVDPGERGQRYEEWPAKGGSELPQPWDHEAMGLRNEVRDLETRPGEPDTVSPVQPVSGYPILTSGSADPSVHELGRALGALGFPSSVSDGENPFGMVDASVMAAVHAFRQAYGVQEDPYPYGGATPQGHATAANHIGPWTWTAVLRAAEHAAEHAA